MIKTMEERKMKMRSSLLLLLSLFLFGCQKNLEKRIIWHIETHCVFQKADTFCYNAKLDSLLYYLMESNAKSDSLLSEMMDSTGVIEIKHPITDCCDTCIIDFEDIFNKKISDIYVFSSILSNLEISEVIGTDYKELFPTIDYYKQIFVFMKENQIVHKEAIELGRISFYEGESVFVFSPQFQDKYKNEVPGFSPPDDCCYRHYSTSKMKVVKSVCDGERSLPSYRLFPMK